VRNERGDVIFAPDSFKPSENLRPWVVLAAESMPFPGDFLCAAVTRSDYPINYELKDEDWVKGAQPLDEVSYCSPWLLNTIKSKEIRLRQGRLTDEFTDRIARDAIQYLDETSAE
jgi:hypothetical protein